MPIAGTAAVVEQVHLRAPDAGSGQDRQLERSRQRSRRHALSRTRRAGGITAADLPRLKLKWAFGYNGVAPARTQPAVAGGRLFVASENGEVHALDPATGCTFWTFKAQAGVRSAPAVAEYKPQGKTRLRRRLR